MAIAAPAAWAWARCPSARTQASKRGHARSPSGAPHCVRTHSERASAHLHAMSSLGHGGLHVGRRIGLHVHVVRARRRRFPLRRCPHILLRAPKLWRRGHDEIYPVYPRRVRRRLHLRTRPWPLLLFPRLWSAHRSRGSCPCVRTRPNHNPTRRQANAARLAAAHPRAGSSSTACVPAPRRRR